jgi:hypothetical protein
MQVGAVLGFIASLALLYVAVQSNPEYFWAHDDPDQTRYLDVLMFAGAAVGAIVGILLVVWLTRRRIEKE